jgi:hypothetical protein
VETKSGVLDIKQVYEGKVVATLARLGVRDRDGDVLKTGLLSGRQIVAIKPQHKWDHVNLGVAEVYETAGQTLEALMEFNLAIPSARDWFESIRFSHEKHHRQEYSFGFQVSDFEHATHSDGKSARFLNAIRMAEVSPVVIGASVGSQTLAIKAQQEGDEAEPTPRLTAAEPLTSYAITPHRKETDDRVWNAWLNQSRVKATCDRMNYYNALYAVADAPGAKERRQFRGLHHFVDEFGEPGPASIRACLELIYQLHKGVFPEHEREGIYTHLAGHLRDAGIDPPPLVAPDNYGVPMDMRVQVSTWAVDAAVEDLIGIHDMRSRKGLTLTEARIQQVKDLYQRLDAFCQILQLKSLDKPYSAQVQEFADRDFAERLQQRLDTEAQAEQQRKSDADRAVAEEHYRRFVDLERRLHGAPQAS